jgi:hypothetical protein
MACAEADILLVQGLPSHCECGFTHALTQSDHLKLQRSAVTKAKRQEASDRGQKGDHRQICDDDKPKICGICDIYEFLSRRII